MWSTPVSIMQCMLLLLLLLPSRCPTLEDTVTRVDPRTGKGHGYMEIWSWALQVVSSIPALESVTDLPGDVYLQLDPDFLESLQ